MKQLLFIFFAIGLAFSLKAQQNGIIADRIIAQVGDNIILKSDIDNARLDYARNAEQEGGSFQLPADFNCTLLQTLMKRKALMIQAQRDSLPVTDDDVDGQVDNRLRYFLQQYGSREQLESVAGKSIYQIKEDLRPDIKEMLLSQKEQQKIVGGVKITPEEVTSYFNSIPSDSLPFYESELELSQIIMHPKANKDVEQYLSDQLLAYKKDVESGKRKFDELARAVSMDPTAKENGGAFPINRLSKMFDPTFTSAAFRLKEGQISPVVKTPFGLHIIQMVSRVGDDAVVRHILLIPTVSDDELRMAVDTLDSVRSRILAKDYNFNAAVSKYSDDDNGKYTGGAYMARDGSTHISIDQIEDKGLVSLIGALNVGDISKPQVFDDPDNHGQKSVRLVYLRSRTDAHRENMRDDYDKISGRALSIKQEKVMNQWFVDHIPSFYVHLEDTGVTGCSTLDEWKRVSEQQDATASVGY